MLGFENSKTSYNVIQEALQDSERKYRNILASIEDGYYEVDFAGNLMVFNDALCRMLAREPEEMLGLNYKKFMSEQDAKRIYEVFNTIFISREATKSLDWQLIRKDGSEIYVETSTSALVGKNNDVTGFFGIIRDISERKEAARALQESERRLADIINFLPDATFAIDMDGRVIIWNRAAEEMTGVKSQDIIGKGDYEYAIAFHGYRRPILVDYVNQTGPGDDCPYISFRKKGGIIEGETFCSAPGIYAWGTATPLYDSHGQLMGAIESVRDINRRQQIEQALQESLDKLQTTLKSTVDALATTSEKRDPYTAGHQKRVARLASAIAEEMGLNQPKCEEIFIAAILHDIGKMQISSEIMSKPGKLNYIEKLFINSHPQASYEIVNTIPFSPQIAKAVLQHHERLDGSGYPMGNTGEDIILEARILAVADVVEAMSSHRPYRPALGITAAMDEIIRYSGILYDADVVKACLRLYNSGKIDFL